MNVSGGSLSSAVREIISTQVTNDIIKGCMATALELVCSRQQLSELPESLLFEIRRWLCAHFVSIRDPSARIAEERIGEASVKYTNVENSSSLKMDGVLSTFWGRTAASLDYTGTLYNLGGPTCKFHSLNAPVLTTSSAWVRRQR